MREVPIQKRVAGLAGKAVRSFPRRCQAGRGKPTSRIILMRLTFINLFIKNLKLASGKYGRLGGRQLKILNDLSTKDSEITREAQEIGQKSIIQNTFAKIIVRNC